MNASATAFAAFRDLVEMICEDNVSVTESASGWARDVEIVASATDVKRLVGDRAQTFRGLAGVLRGIGIGTGVSYNLMPVVARKGTVAREFEPFAEQAEWPRERIGKAVETVLHAAFPGAVQSVQHYNNSSGSEQCFTFEVRLTTPLKRPAEIFVEALDRVLRLVGIRQGRMLHAKLVLV